MSIRNWQAIQTRVGVEVTFAAVLAGIFKWFANGGAGG